VEAIGASRKLIRWAAFGIPVALFAAIPLLDIWASPYFAAYVIFYVVIVGLLAVLKRKIDGSWTW
jgi:hypothetical protein